MAINIVDPRLTSYISNLGRSAAVSQSTETGSAFSQLLNTVLSAQGGTGNGTDLASYLENYGAQSVARSLGVETGGQMLNLDTVFQQAAEKYGLPVELLKAVGKAESNFDPAAKSSAGAMGVMQLMPKTAESLGVTDPFDPVQNIMGGANYLSQMLSQVHGNVELALAAYNAGPGNVQKYGGVPPFEETQNYIRKVMEYCSEDLVAGVAPAQSSAGFDSGNSLSGVSAKDLSTMMTLYRYQTELSMLSSIADNGGDEDSTTNLFSDSMMNLL